MTPTQPSLWRGGALLLGLAVAWGANWPLNKTALAEIQVWTLRGWTCAGGALILFALAALNGGRIRPARGEWRPLATAAFLNVTVWHILVGFGMLLMGSGHAAVLGFTMPLWAALLSVLLGERLTGTVLAALALGTGGIFVLLARDLSAIDTSPLGIAFMLIAAFSWAVGTLYQKRQRWRVSALALAAWQIALGALPIWIVMIFSAGALVPQASLGTWIVIVYIALVSLGFAYYAWFRLVALYPAHIAAISTLLCPIVGVISGAYFLGEPFGWREIVALVMVGSALALVLIVPALRPQAAVT